jgi:hypothetical protein
MLLHNINNNPINNNKDYICNDDSSFSSEQSGDSSIAVTWVFNNDFEISGYYSPGRSKQIVVSLSVDDDKDDASTNHASTNASVIDLVSTDESSTDHSTLSRSSWFQSKLRKSKK